MRTSEEMTVQWLWERQSVWSQAANHAKRAIGRARSVALTLGVTGACAGTAAAQVMPWNDAAGKALAFLAAVVVGLVPLATMRAGPQQVREWTRMRLLSEQLKSEIYTYLAGVAPYRDADASRKLREHTDLILSDTSDLTSRTLAFVPRQRPIPAVTDVRTYSELRVASQVERYYRPRAVQMSRRSARARRAEWALAATAVVLGAASGTFGVNWASAWVATITTVTAAVTAHFAASRYAYQEMEFSRTAEELERLTALRTEALNPTADDAADDAFVGRCERVISAQNEEWMAKWLSE